MCSKQKIRKIAWCLLLVALFSLIPTSTFSVLADSDIVPPFPYDELQTIGKNNYLLFKVHGIEQVDYVECIVSGRGIHGAFDSTLSGLSYSSLGGWVLQINAIDYCFKNGQKVDFDLQSLFTTSYMPVDNDDSYYSAWLEFVYTTTDVWGVDEDQISGYNVRFYKAQNFIIEPAATPTPSPTPDVPIISYFPAVTDSYFTIKSGSQILYTSKQLLIMRFYSETDNKYMFRYFTLFSRKFFGSVDSIPFITSVNEEGSSVKVTASNISGSSGYLKYNIFVNEENNFTYFDSLETVLNTTISLSNHSFEISDMTKVSENDQYFTYSPGGDYYFEDAIYGNINSDGTVDFGEGSGTTPATPTPTSAPTPIPQPSATPAPDDERPGWGWGIVSTLRYIFIPDKNKLIRLEKTTQTRFQQFGGGYDDLKKVSGFEDPVRPQNVVMNWKPFGTDSEEQQQQITLVDFEQIDFYLFQTSSGMFICECLKASFTFLMFGYLIHVIRKHFVIENNTSDENDGGGD